MGHGEGDVLPVAIGQDVLLLGNPLLGAFQSTGAAGVLQFFNRLGQPRESVCTIRFR